MRHKQEERNDLSISYSLLQCADTLTRLESRAAKPLCGFFECIERKRRKKKAVVALVRKLLPVARRVRLSEWAEEMPKLEWALVA